MDHSKRNDEHQFKENFSEYTNYENNSQKNNISIDGQEENDSNPDNISKTISHNKTTLLTRNWFHPRPGIKWQWQLSDKLDLSYDVDIYDVDLEEISKELIEQLHKKNIKVICYFNAGAYEPYRNDSFLFPKEVLGKTMKDWNDEKWLDISRFYLFKNIITKRLDLAVTKDCDGVEPDNINAYLEDSGFPLSFDDQLKYNKWLSSEAHKRNLSIALKNDGEQADLLIDFFDFAVVEDCFYYDDCDQYKIFIDNNKAVLGVEYFLEPKEFCKKANRFNFSFLKKNIQLDSEVIFCN